MRSSYILWQLSLEITYVICYTISISLSSKGHKMSKQAKFTLTDFYKKFPDEETALDWLRHKLYPEKIYCPNCKKATKHHRITTRKVYGCDNCGHQMSPTAGTIFHKSSTPLQIWLYVVFQMAQTRGGIAAKQIERETGVTYKTAWRMCNEVRKRLGENGTILGVISNDNDDSDSDKTDKTHVEMDESYFGGKPRKDDGKTYQRERGTDKTPVFGMVERKGRIKAVVVPDTKSKTLTPIIEESVGKGINVYTDEYLSYNGLAKRGCNHFRILHQLEIYVMGNVHTQTIEGFWALVKNGIKGVFHHCSRKYLQDYLNEYAFRYNHRNDSQSMFLTMLHIVVHASPSQ
jgi:transposase